MAINITNTTQLLTFSLIRGILRSNSIISSKFSVNDFYEFDPLVKDITFSGYPFIVINIPTTDTNSLTMPKTQTIKEFEVIITLIMDWVARDNFVTYSNAIISQIESAMGDFEASGYYLDRIDTETPMVTDLSQKKIIEGTFRVYLKGGVAR